MTSGAGPGTIGSRADERFAANAARAIALGGPALAQVEALGPIDWPLWARTAEALAASLGRATDLDWRLHHLYLPVLFFSLARLRLAASRPLVIGLQAPQGSGKTTLVSHLLAALPALGLRGAGVSIDDFYLPRDEQVALSAAHPGNPYLRAPRLSRHRRCPVGRRPLRG